jgi:hypothetical protein
MSMPIMDFLGYAAMVFWFLVMLRAAIVSASTQ